jgi:hypothetical protein
LIYLVYLLSHGHGLVQYHQHHPSLTFFRQKMTFVVKFSRG